MNLEFYLFKWKGLYKKNPKQSENEQVNSMFGMNQRNITFRIALIVAFGALVSFAIMLIRIPNPMDCYFNLRDVLVFVSALTFGLIICGFCFLIKKNS